MTNKEWFKSRKWGIFIHYLYFGKTNFRISKGEKIDSYNDFIDRFDVEAFAKNLSETNCGYVIFTLGQCFKYWCAPNENFNKITGCKPGEACSNRDLIADLLDALDKYDIPLFLYYTGDGPVRDEKIGTAMGYYTDNSIGNRKYVTKEFVENWSSVLKEYSLRYGKRIKGWWIDGCYEWIGYNDELLEILKNSAIAGNPDALCAFNNGTENKDYNNPIFAHLVDENDNFITKMEKIEEAFLAGEMEDTGIYMNKEIDSQWRAADDYTAGERTVFDAIPKSDKMEKVWHILSFLAPVHTENSHKPKYLPNGGGWSCCGSKYSGEYLRNYVKAVNEKNGVVSIDIASFCDGSFDMGQIEVLKSLKDIRED